MNKVKKFLCVVLATLLVCIIASCGKKNSEPTEAETTEQTEPETTAFTFPDETSFYAHGGYSEDNDPFGTEATEPEATKPNATESTEPTKKDDTTVPTTAPTEPTVKDEPETPTTEATTAPTEQDNTQSGTSTVVTEYERYIAMSPAEQAAFYSTFDSPEAFTAWYHNAMAEYERQKNSVDVDGGVADLGGFA